MSARTVKGCDGLVKGLALNPSHLAPHVFRGAVGALKGMKGFPGILHTRARTHAEHYAAETLHPLHSGPPAAFLRAYPERSTSTGEIAIESTCTRRHRRSRPAIVVTTVSLAIAIVLVHAFVSRPVASTNVSNAHASGVVIATTSSTPWTTCGMHTRTRHTRSVENAACRASMWPARAMYPTSDRAVARGRPVDASTASTVADVDDAMKTILGAFYARPHHVPAMHVAGGNRDDDARTGSSLRRRTLGRLGGPRVASFCSKFRRACGGVVRFDSARPRQEVTH